MDRTFRVCVGAIIAVSFAFAALSCGDGGSGAEPTCDPGAVQTCPCGGGEPDGTQVCNTDGSAWGECDCGGDSDSDTDVDTDTDSDSDTDTDTDGDTDTDTDSDTDTDTDTETDTTGCLEGSYTITNSLDVALLEPFTCVTGNLTISAPGMTNLDLLNLEWVGGDLEISGNETLENLDGLSALTSVGHLDIQNNYALTSLNGLGGITSVGGVLRIVANPALTSLDGLGGITSVVGLQIESNYALTSLNGLGGITSVGGILWVRLNDTLPQCEACDLLDQVIEFTGTFSAYSNQPDTCSDDCI